MKNIISGIYGIKCNINNKIYIGYSKNCYNRYTHHKYKLNGNIHNNEHLQNAWNKYGKSNFILIILEKCDLPEKLPGLEDIWCKKYKSHNRKFGYNINPTGPDGKTYNSEETRRKISISNTGKKCKKETIEKLKLFNTGKKLSNDCILKLRNNPKNIKIDQYDINGNFIFTYNSIREASRILNIQSKRIKSCIIGDSSYRKGFIFKYHNDLLTREEIKNRATFFISSNNRINILTP